MEIAEVNSVIGSISEQCLQGQCVLFLGPDLLTGKDKVPLYQEFSHTLFQELQQLAKEKDKKIFFDEQRKGDLTYTSERYIHERNRLLGYTSVTEIGLKKRLSQYIDDHAFTGSMYQQLSELPFYLILNASFDRHIYELIKKNRTGEDVQHFFAYYDNYKGKNETNTRSRLPDEIDYYNNVVYNVFGFMGEKKDKPQPSFANCESIILKELEFMNYSKNINLPDNGIPSIITNFLNRDKTCLFLGFQHEDWHLKILLKALSFPKETTDKNSYSLWNFDRISSHNHFYEDEMKFLFIPQNPELFVDTLYRTCMPESQEAPRPASPRLKRTVNIVYISDLSDDRETEYDQDILDRVSGQLKGLETNGMITQWSEALLKASDNRQQEIQRRYEQTDLFVVLAGVTFLSSKYYERLELAVSMTGKNPSAKIIPLYLRHFSIPDIPGIQKGQWLPVDQAGQPTPIKSGPEDEQDKKIKDICEFIIKQIHNTGNV